MLSTDNRYETVLHGLVCYIGRHGDDNAHGDEEGGEDRATVSDAAVTAGLYSVHLAS